MNAKSFVRALSTVVNRAVEGGAIDVLRSPPGRRPPSETIRMSQWFNQLSQSDQHNVSALLRLAAEQASYTFLGVLDGLVAVEPVGEKGKLVLSYEKDGDATVINDPQELPLTVLFKEKAG